MKLGYARVSTDEQSLDVQLEQLKAAGCTLIFEEKASGKNAKREQLMKLLGGLERLDETFAPADWQKMGPDVIVVTKLDRLARNTRDLLEIVDRIGKAGAGLISLGEPWADTTSPAGRMVMTVLAGVAEFERARILERTSEGRAHAKKNGVRFGRPSSLTGPQQREVHKMLERGDSIGRIARLFQVHRNTISRLKP